MLACLLFAASCGDDQPEVESVPQYEGWTRYTYGHFIINFSPSTIYSTDKAKFARGYERYLTKLCEMLEMPVPDDKIHFYVYSQKKEALNITGRDTPFSNDTDIHWAGEYHYGYPLTKFLLNRQGISPGQFEVFNEGIAHLLDFSGKNYHDRVSELVDSGKFVGVAELGDNAVFDTLALDIKRPESASLIGFIMYNYGLDRLFMLNSSLAGWEVTIETLFHMKIDVFQQSWLDFAREHNTPDNAAQSDDSP
jgi:hypothetical protein